MNIFGKSNDSLDRDVRIFLKENVFDKNIKSKGTDSRLLNVVEKYQVSILNKKIKGFKHSILEYWP